MHGPRCFCPMGHILEQPSVFLHASSMLQSLVMAVCAEPESIEAVLPCTHVSNATEQQASSLGKKLDAVFFQGSPPSS